MTTLDGEAIQKFQNFMYLSSLTFFGNKGGNYSKGEYYSREDIEY